MEAWVEKTTETTAADAGWDGRSRPATSVVEGAAAADVAPVRSVVGWEAALTRRMRVLLHAQPLLDLKRNDALVGPELRHYDSLALATKLLDTIVDTMGLLDEVDRAALLRILRPLLLAQDEAAGIPPDRRRHEAMVDRVLGALRNDGNQRRPFAVDYQDFDDAGRPVRRLLEFRLVSDWFHPGGGIVLRLSSEAINLYLNALELDIEDAQAAAEAVIQSQLARGRFSEALESSRNARLQSLRFQDKVVRILRDTRRDVGSVDWRGAVPRLLADALTHIQSRLATEENILATGQERLDVLPSGDDQARAVADVVRLVRDCRARHIDLHDQLMRARNVFLDEQGRQAFTPPLARPLPELAAEVLEPMLRLGRAVATAVADDVLPSFCGAAAPPVFSLADQVLWQLRPRRTPPQAEVLVLEADPSDHLIDLGHYPEPVRHQAAGILAAIDSPVRLSTLLEDARQGGAAPDVLELVALLALQHYAPEHGDASFAVERCDGETLDACGFFGDELELSGKGRP